MNRASLRRLANAGLLSLGVAVLGACSAESPSTPTLEKPSFGYIPGPGGTPVLSANNTIVPEMIKVCKAYSGAVGPAVTIQVQVDAGNNGGAPDYDFNVTVADGECWEVWTTDGNANVIVDKVTFTETGPAGYNVSYVLQTREDGTIVTNAPVASNTGSVLVTNPGGTGFDGVVWTFTNTEIVADALFLLIDEDGIDNGPRYWLNTATSFTSSTIKKWSTNEVNDDRPGLAQRLPLRWFAKPENLGQTFWFFTGQVGDEGWFAPKHIPDSWAGAGPGSDGLRNFLGDPTQPFASPKHLVGPGLGTGSDPEKLLDKIPHVIPLRAEGLYGLIGRTVCALVWDSDISVNFDQSKPELGINGVLKGEKLGVVAFDVLDVIYLPRFSSSTLPRVQVTIRDANVVCKETLGLYLTAPEPRSSSEPMDIRPNNPVDNQGYVFF